VAICFDDPQAKSIAETAKSIPNFFIFLSSLFLSLYYNITTLLRVKNVIRKLKPKPESEKLKKDES
jgi:hypothetical protein